jgi:hypothetical protein
MDPTKFILGFVYSCETHITVLVLGGVPNVEPKKQEKNKFVHVFMQI